MTTPTITPQRATHVRLAGKSSSPGVRAAIGTSSADSVKAARAAIPVATDPSRDALLTNFGRATLVDRYLLAGETSQDLFARVARAYADDAAHAQRLYDY